jgi:phosphatidylserine/phosphatidylglycerophosphate/cardiolipin synthase-like enzyme
MSTPPSALGIEPLTGAQVAQEVIQCIGAFRLLRTAMIISYTLQDYEFTGHGLVSDLLRRQLALGAKITVLTTPPPFNPKKNPYKDKLRLLEKLEADGIRVLLNERVHAKVYLFSDADDRQTAIVGSANLSHGGFGVKGTDVGWHEVSLVCSDNDLFKKTTSLVENGMMSDRNTMEFSTWRTLNLSNIAIAKSGESDD